MSIPAMITMAAAFAFMASPALAGGGSGARAHHHPGVQGQVHDRLGGPRYEQRPDPNHQNPYRPMYSLDATPPGQPHPYFRTRNDGFGYPASRPVEVYLGNGIYVIPR